MYKKSELYKLFTRTFLEQQQTDANIIRINSLGTDSKEIINISQQAATETVVEIVLIMLAKLGIIEDDCEITSKYRHDVIFETADEMQEK